ncbi:MAG TPA: DUF6049 family protein [Actinotalea sp.]|nr:DUF6049 family protein [Actinotalea sp.]
MPSPARGLAALTMVGLTLGWALVPVGPATAAAPAAQPGGAVRAVDGGLPVEIEVERIAPQALAPGQDLTVDLRVTNVGDAALGRPRVIVRLARAPFISRTSLDRWRDASTTASAGTSVLEIDLPAPLEPGSAADLRAVVPAASIGLRTTASTWGARGLAVEVVDAADPARVRLGLVRTFVVWLPPQEVVPTTVTVLVPVVGPVPDATAGSELAALTASGGRLDRVLRSTADRPVSWALDPWLLEVSPSDPALAAPDAVVPPQDDAGTWPAALIDAAPQDVQLLPWGDADVTALAHADETALLATATARSADVADAAGLSGGALLRWPGDARPDLATASAVGDEDRALVVGPGELEPPAVLTYTPSGRTTVSTAAGEVPVLVPDARLSTALTTGRVDEPVVDDSGEADGADEAVDTIDPQLTGAVAAADLLAELAVITRERPSDGRHLLLTVPRDWNPDPSVASAQLAALSAVPWVATAPVADLLAVGSTGVDRGTLPELSTEDTEVGAGQLDAVQRTVEERERVARMGDDPAALVGEPEVEVLTPAALAWRADTAGRTAQVASSVATTQALRAAVQVQRGSDVLLVSTTSELPVRVANSLDQGVVVQVVLVPGSPQLVVDEVVTVTVPAGGEVSTVVPVHAVQSADVPVVVELRTLDGVLINDTAEFVVRVRAEWEGIGTAVLGALLAIGVVIGILRTVRRGRGRRGTPHSDLGPDDLSPEQVAADDRTGR